VRPPTLGLRLNVDYPQPLSFCFFPIKSPTPNAVIYSDRRRWLFLEITRSFYSHLRSSKTHFKSSPTNSSRNAPDFFRFQGLTLATIPADSPGPPPPITHDPPDFANPSVKVLNPPPRISPLDHFKLSLCTLSVRLMKPSERFRWESWNIFSPFYCSFTKNPVFSPS